MNFRGICPTEVGDNTSISAIKTPTERFSARRPYNSAEDRFYAASFGADGRISGISYKLNDLENANRSDGYGYYLKTTFYGRTGEKVDVSLSPAVTGNEKTEGAGTYLIGTPLWNSEQIIHNDGGNGAEDAVQGGLQTHKTR